MQETVTSGSDQYLAFGSRIECTMQLLALWCVSDSAWHFRQKRFHCNGTGLRLIRAKCDTESRSIKQEYRHLGQAQAP
jgi:hypothetical protein